MHALPVGVHVGGKQTTPLCLPPRCTPVWGKAGRCCCRKHVHLLFGLQPLRRSYTALGTRRQGGKSVVRHAWWQAIKHHNGKYAAAAAAAVVGRMVVPLGAAAVMHSCMAPHACAVACASKAAHEGCKTYTFSLLLLMMLCCCCAAVLPLVPQRPSHTDRIAYLAAQGERGGQSVDRPASWICIIS